ncbi:E3 ubiquitin-protein ligase TRIM47-like isoform X1 [Brachyhypopomus gauderio]|uniref:E3 ubiquitin-protein ligase TRIM47-like isoform X1 n=1 Tax=Brachyhypopomus gauderio TaxID=698409 RepID=UPI004041975D
MAKSVSSSQDSFSCPICLDLLKDPVTIPCGHSYCLGCISYYWDQNHNNQKDVYNCPQCRRTFSSRPGLYKSTTIVEMMEQLKNAGILVTPAGQDGCVGVSCDVCSGEKHEAVRSCLVCLASYCELHLQPHYQSTAFKKHKLVKASTNLQEKLCSEHEKMLEAFCRTDHQCVCMQCMLGKHKGHDIIIADTERGERQKHLEEIQRKFKQRIQEREKELQELRSEMDTYKHSAQAAVKDCEMIYTELIRSIERRCAEVTELIRAQEKTAVGRAERVLRQLEQEVTELKNRDAELEQLLHTEDHIRFLQRFSSVSAPPTELPSVTVNQLYTFKDVVKSISELRERLEDLSKQDMHKLSADVKAIHITGPLIREDFLEYACHLTLDPNTAYRHLCLTEGNKKPLLLRDKLVKMEVDMHLVTWITDYLTGRPQHVRIRDCSSDTVISNTGAPQGTVLSPVLFTLYTSDFKYDSESCHMQKFSDDTAIVGCVRNGQEMEYRSLIEDFVVWCKANHLQLNITKTKEMCIDFRRSRPSQQPVSIDGVNVEMVKAYKFLGVHLDERLDWSVNTDHLYRKAQSRLYFLRRLASFRICQKLLLMFYQSVVASVLFYAVVCWGGSISKRDAGRIDRLVRKAGSVLGLQLEPLTPLAERRALNKLLNIMDNVHHPLHSTITRQRSSFSGRLLSKSCSTDRLRKSFVPQAIRLFNSSQHSRLQTL